LLYYTLLASSMVIDSDESGKNEASKNDPTGTNNNNPTGTNNNNNPTRTNNNDPTGSNNNTSNGGKDGKCGNKPKGGKKSSLFSLLFGNFNESNYFGGIVQNNPSQDSREMLGEEDEKEKRFADDDYFETTFYEDIKQTAEARRAKALEMLREMKGNGIDVDVHLQNLDAFIADNIVDLDYLIEADEKNATTKKTRKTKKGKRDRETKDDEENLPDTDEAPPDQKKTTLDGNYHFTF
jgi:hypothetical protein